ncbi:MAG: Calx-beta domain-containing protein, partial [Cyanobacteria bacterium J06559_3]
MALINISEHFGSVSLTGFEVVNPTSIQFGHDGRLYVSQQDGIIKAATVQATTDPSGVITGYTVVGDIETIELIQDIPNHDDDGALNTTLGKRQSTGLAVEEGPNGEVVLYVGSSDPRIGGGGKGDKNLDTNSSIISRLTQQPDGSWEKVDLVIGLPRSEENHSINGLDIRTEIVNGEARQIMYITSGGNTNAGAPGGDFEWIPEYYYSSAILRVDLTQLEQMEADLIANGGLKGGTDYVDPYVYALPTLDDPMRANDANGHDISAGTTGAADAEAGSVFGGNNGRNQAKYDANGPVQIYSMGYRNQYDVVVTEAGNIYTSDNGPNKGWGNKPITKNDESVTSSSQVASNKPNIDVDDGNDNGKDNLHIVTDGFYAGHPNPVYASGAAAGLYTVDESSGTPVVIELTDPSDPNNDPMTTADDLPSDWNTITGGITHPEAGVYLQPTGSSPILDGSIKGPDGSLLRYGSSTNGLDEYTAAAELSDVANSEIIITSSFNGDVTFAEITSDGTQTGTNVTDVDVYNVGGTPLDLTAVGASGIDGQGLHAGTIWVAQFGADTLTVLVPGVAPEPDTDKDDDGIDNIFDPLQDDATNGANTVLQAGGRLLWDFNPSDSGQHPVPSGEFNIGMTGWMTNGTDDLSGLRNLDNTIRGGAPGIVQVKNVGVGSAVGTTNNQQDAIQTGFIVDSGVDKFTLKVPVLNPFASDANSTVSWYEPASMGFALGDGTQSNFLQIAVVATNEVGNATVPAIRVTYEENDTLVTEFEVAVPALLSSVDTDQIELFLNVDMQALQVTPTWRHQTNGIWSNIQQVGPTPVQLTSTGAVANALQGQNTIQNGQGQSIPSGSVVTLTSTASGYEPFTADFLDLTIATPGIVIQETDGKTEVTETGIGDTYAIVLNTPPTSDVTVNLAPNAQIGLDKTSLVFTPSNWGVAQTVTITAVNDSVEEGDQQVTIGHTVTSTDADYSNLTLPDLDVTVIDNDAPPLVEINNITVDEDAGTASFTVSLAQASDSQITVDYATADGTALAGSDYTATSGTLTFAPGDVNQTVTVNITDDADPESDQTFQVDLSNAVNAVIGDGSGTATIADNDTNVLYRVNVGGDAVTAPDGDVDWTADTAANPSPYRIGNGGDKFYSSVQSVDLSNPSLPAGALDQAIFQTQRYDGKAAPSMQWAFDVEQGSDVEVRLYFSEWWTAQPGGRDFDVAVEGTVPSVFDDIDIAAIAGDKKTGIMLSYITTVQDDTLNLEFLHGAVSNPWLSGIEVIAAGDVPPAIAIADVTVVDEDTGTATITIDLSKASTETITVDYATSDGTATAGSDYTAATGTATFLPGQTSATFTVNLLDDTTFEGGETFNLTLSNATGGAVIEDSDGSVTILENETPPPAFSVVDVTVDEGSGAATFTVSLSAASNDTLTIDYATADDIAAAGSDYTAVSGSLTFLPGELTQNVTVDILEDTDFEGDETFTFNLSNVGGDATIADGTAIGTIDENEPSPTGVLYRVNVGGDTVTAPDGDMDWSADTATDPSAHRISNGGNKFYSAGGTVDLTNPILPTGALDQSIFQTQRYDGKAAPSMQWAFDVDPGNIEVRLYFAEWWGSGSAGERVFDVAVEGNVPTAFDDIDIADLAGGKKKGTMLSYTTAVTDGTLDLEFLHGSISNPWLSGIEVINVGEVPPTVAIADVTVDEAAGTATFTATLSEAGTETITVDYTTTDGTATAGSDFTAANGTLSFAAGETTKTFTVAIAEDALYEGDETFTVNLSNITGGATIGTDTATGTITDNETPPPSLAIADVTVDENAGTATFTVNLSAAANQIITVDYATADDTATAGSDYLTTGNTLTFLAG